MNIQEERQFILSENNTAQQQVIDFLETLIPSSTTELHFSDALSGEIDFSVLNSMGFKKIKSIHLGEGKVTDISHIPKTVSRFFCEKNILITLEDLPSTIVEIHCSHNHIRDIELSGLSNLVKLNCSYNELTKLENIPESIQEIYCDNNDISQLDLDNLFHLKTLHCSNNKLMVIKNLPSQLVELKMENNPMAEIDHMARDKDEKNTDDKETGVKIDLIEGLQHYFRLKNNYENKRRDKMSHAFHSAKTKRVGKLRAAAVNPPCVNCKRPVGTIFAKKDNKYIALCGDKDAPCNLNIQIFCSTSFNREKTLYTYQEILDESKESIIKQKLDTLFNYINESKSAELFKKELDHYNESARLYKDFLSEYEDIYSNMHKRELIVRKQEDIYELLEAIQSVLNEYQKTNNPELLKTAVQMQKDELIPKIEMLRVMKYEIMEMNDEIKVYGKDDDKVLLLNTYLVQKETLLSKNDYSIAFSEPSHVIKFSKLE